MASLTNPTTTPPSSPPNLAALVTVVITTSPSPLHPSTVHIEKVMESLRIFTPQLAGCRKIVLCDGCLVREKNKFRSGRVTQDAFNRYTAYKHALANLFATTNSKGSNNGGNTAPSVYAGEKYELIELKERHGFGFAVRSAMFNHVQTPMVMIVQHDRTIMRPVDVPAIVS